VLNTPTSSEFLGSSSIALNALSNSGPIFKVKFLSFAHLACSGTKKVS
jgi:hypothetical protein